MIWGLEVIFVCGLSLITSALNVYIRDMRYIVESANTVLFWLVPVVYSFAIIPANYRPIYQLNPVAALVMAMRDILIDGTRPGTALLLQTHWNLALHAGFGPGGLSQLEAAVLRSSVRDHERD